MEQLQAVAGLHFLDALRFAARSRHNRATLLRQGLLPALARVLKAALNSLNSLAAVIGEGFKVLDVLWMSGFPF